jgi:hypothetical protein
MQIEFGTIRLSKPAVLRAQKPTQGDRDWTTGVQGFSQDRLIDMDRRMARSQELLYVIYKWSFMIFKIRLTDGKQTEQTTVCKVSREICRFHGWALNLRILEFVYNPFLRGKFALSVAILSLYNPTSGPSVR